MDNSRVWAPALPPERSRRQDRCAHGTLHAFVPGITRKVPARGARRRGPGLCFEHTADTILEERASLRDDPGAADLKDAGRMCA
jgi:hypothetical protein